MKTVSLEEAVSIIPNGATLMIGGFMGVGTPERLIDELVRQGKRNLTIIANDNAMPGRGIGKLVDAGLGGVLTPTGVGTIVEEGKQRIEVSGKAYLLETALRADFALLGAFLAD